MKIVLVGDGWGAIALYNSFIKENKDFGVFTEDFELLGKIKIDGIKLLGRIEDLEDCLIICAGYKKIIKKEMLNKNKIINIHYSLLPKYREYHSTVWAIINDEKYLGLTIHEMNEYIDDGDIIYQYKVENDKKKTSEEYMLEFNKFIEKNAFRIIEKYIKKEIIPIKQNKKDASWVGKRNIEDCKINFESNIEELKSFFRALVKPYPLPYIEVKGIKYEILDFSFHPSDCKSHIGRVLNIDDEGVYIRIKDGYLILKKLYNSGNEYSANEIINKIGIKLL